MLYWGLFSLAVIAVPTAALLAWLYGQHRSNRRRRKFLHRYKHRSVAGIRQRVEHELSTADTQVIPKVRRRSLPPDPLLDGRMTGELGLPKRVRGYTLKPTPYPRTPSPHSDPELMQRVLDSLRRLE